MDGGNSMETVVHLIFALELALLFVHEMDAVRRQEWNMFAILKDMAEEKAYQVFTLLHIPLYTAMLVLLFSDHAYIGVYITDIFLIAHLLIHVLFRKHPANKLNGRLSRNIIYSAGLLAFAHLVLYSILV